MEWSVNSEHGYFQLGSPQPNDDLYIMNITLVNAIFFNRLFKSTSVGDSSEWSVVFEAFGMNIQSDIFKLNDKMENRLTYLGDKSTARIRASTVAFTKFLSEMTFVMQVEACTKENHTDVVGIGSVSLRPLVHPDVHEIREDLAIVPQNSQISVAEQFYPKMKVVIDATASLQFFATYIKLEEIHVPAQNITRSKDNLSQLDSDSIRQDSHAVVIQDSNSVRQDSNTVREESNTVREESNTVRQVSNTVNQNSNTVFQNSNTVFQNSNTVFQNSNTVFQNSNTVRQETRTISSSPNKKITPRSANHSCKLGELHLKFKSFTIKSKSAIRDDWAISFHHPPSHLDVKTNNNEKIILVGMLDSSVAEKNVHHFQIAENDSDTLILSIPNSTQEVLEASLQIFFHKEAQAKKAPLALTKISIGNMLSTMESDQGTQSKDTPIHTLPSPGSNAMKIGYLNYELTWNIPTTLRKQAKNFDGEKLASMVEKVQLEPNNNYEPYKEQVKERAKSESRSQKSEPRSHNDTESLHEWRVETERKFKRELKEKEESYLQILATEYKKQKEESEKIVKAKLDEYESLKKECSKKLRSLCDREETLSKKEKEFQDLVRANALEQNGDLEKIKLENRRLKEEHKIETASLSRQLEQALAENKAIQGKIRILQEKLSQSEEKYAELLTMRHKWPEAETQRKLDSLEQKCEQLTRDLDMALKEKQTYKTQAQKLVKELERKSEESKEQLRDENENLKLQLVASRQQQLLNKDLEQVTSLSKELRVVKDQFERQQKRGRAHSNKPVLGHPNNINSRVEGSPPLEKERNDNILSPKTMQSATLLQEEIEKLMRTRDALLKTQAYTPYDPLIRTIEKEINKKLQCKKELSLQKNTNFS